MNSLATADECARTGTERMEASLRLVDATDEARRRLERDLHDGPQQSLVLVALALTQARAHAKGTPVEPFVAEAVRLLHQSLGELRELARGIHPWILSQRGLSPALAAFVARTPFPVGLRTPREPAPPAAEAAM